MNSINPDSSFQYGIPNGHQRNFLDKEILDALPSSVFITDLEGHILFWNRILDIWLVQKPIETGTSLNVVLEASQNPPLTQPSEFLENALAEVILSDVSSGVLILVNGSQIRYDVKRIQLDRLVWSFSDISAIKRTEEFARFYLDLMGHDIRNRLQEILFFTNILSAKPEESDIQDILSNMSALIIKCGNLIQKVKTTENLDLIDLEEHQLSEVVAAVVERVSTRFPETDIHLQIHNSLCQIRADKYLSILVENIVENGIVHNSSDSKQVWLRIDEAPLGYELRVSDNGPGIEDRRKRDIFDRHRRYGGVGLHIASMIIEKYGGHISIHDRLQKCPNAGAMVKVWFPATELPDNAVDISR
ncbi:MAG: sensor histidine kinase [Candidatus Thorarchaeota archaeon]|nr:sensor histidine kinase [Candidatus Thorarchaeota archaeon]